MDISILEGRLDSLCYRIWGWIPEILIRPKIESYKKFSILNLNIFELIWIDPN